MCSIIGLISKKEGNVRQAMIRMLKRTSHRGPDGAGIIIGKNIRKAKKVGSLNLRGLNGRFGLGHLRLKITGDKGIQPLYDCNKRFALAFNGEIWNYQQLRSELEGLGHKFETDSDGESIVHMIEEDYSKSPSLLNAVKQVTKRLDGEFVFAVADTKKEEFFLVRDKVGIKQLYYAENAEHIAFCSEKKPLWDMKLEPKRVLPGMIVSIKRRDGKYLVKKYITNPLEKKMITIHKEDKALKKYEEAIFHSVSKRISGQKKIGIIFSGGVDSVMIAQIAKRLGAKLICYTAGFSGSQDIINAKKSAKELGMDLRVNILDEDKIRAELKNIIAAIESKDHLQVDVAIPIFFAVKIAREDGIKVMLTGQGADELFAGYPWYKEILKKEGATNLNNALWNDIGNLYKDTLEREDKITMVHSIELRVPFLDPEVISVAMSISEKQKIKGSKIKYIHRQLADRIGVPSDISWRPKEAAQHGSNVHQHLKKIIKNYKITNQSRDLCSEKTEKLGSAHRYSHDVYRDNQSIQNVLSHIGCQLGINDVKMVKKKHCKKPKAIIFTDLDNTLLDENYSFKAAKKALNALKEREIPLILCTSKTKEETKIYIKKLRINDPFICESGGTIHIPNNYFDFGYSFQSRDKEYNVVIMGANSEELNRVVNEIKKTVKAKVLSELSVNEIKKLTNLPTKEAKLVKRHKYELALILDKKYERIARKIIEKNGFNFRKGKFCYVKKSDKGKAVKILTSLFKRKHGLIKTYAIGDSPNDFDMFDVVDEPYLLGNKYNRNLPKGYHKINKAGPEGWQTIVLNNIINKYEK